LAKKLHAVVAKRNLAPIAEARTVRTLQSTDSTLIGHAASSLPPVMAATEIVNPIGSQAAPERNQGPNPIGPVATTAAVSRIETTSAAPIGRDLSANAPNDDIANELRAYRLTLALGARKFRVYPVTLRDQGVGGRVEIEVHLLPGASPTLSVRHRSGHSALDNAALEMVGQSLDATSVPKSLVPHRLTFVLPIEFVPPE
jgi:outer membrane biosynthesis protein TonB